MPETEKISIGVVSLFKDLYKATTNTNTQKIVDSFID